MILKDKITVAIRQDRPERNIFKTIYLTRQQAERATASVNHYLQEQDRTNSSSSLRRRR